MEIQVTTNMQDVIRETMEAEMNICYLLTKGTLTPEEKEEITNEYIKRIFSELDIRDKIQNIGQQLMQEILDTYDAIDNYENK